MKQIDLTKGKVWQSLIALALPLMGSSLLQFTYNLVDTLFVGHLGSNSVASVGSSSFFIGLGYAINALVVIGTGIKVSHSVGSGKQEAVKGYIQSGMFLNSLIGVFYMSFLLLAGKQLIGFLGLGNIEIERNSYLYLAWSAPMLFFAFFNTLFARILGSVGNTKSPLKINAAGIITNIVLDPILIYGLGWGVTGAAVATLIANVMMFICYMRLGKGLFSFSFIKNWKGNEVGQSSGSFFKLEERALKEDLLVEQEGAVTRERLKEIITLGFPIAFQRILFSLVNIILAKMVANFGAEAIAAQKIGLQIESVVYMVTGGLNGAVASFIGQNYGAKKSQRMQKGYQTALIIGSIYAVISAGIFWLIPEQLAHLFVKESETIMATATYLRVIAFSQLFNAIEMVSNGFFTGMGNPKVPATVSMIFTALRIPMAFIFIRNIGIQGIWWAISLSTILKGLTLYVLYHFKAKPKMRQLMLNP